MGDIWRTFRVSVAAILVSAGLLTSWLALPQSVAACSCFTGDLAAWARLPDIVIFSGTVQPSGPVGLDVVVDRWFVGDGARRVVPLDPDGFGPHGESCQAGPPPPGTRWLFGAGWRPGTDLMRIDLCSLRADLSTVDGRAVLAAAVKRFPDATTPPVATDDPRAGSPVATPGVVTVTQPLYSLGDIVPILGAGALILMVAGILAIAVAVARRARASD